MNQLAVIQKNAATPAMPESWNYDDSVGRMRQLVYKWKNLTLEVATELWVAREKLAVDKAGAARIMHDANASCMTWSGYCKDVGINYTTANRWLNKWFPQDASKSNQTIDDEMCAVSDLYELIGAGKKFKTITADPPWAYSNQATRAATDNHYKTMTIDEICNLPIKELADESAHLHLWTTNAFLYDSARVMEAWGFEYKSVFIWTKPSMGIGNYWRVSHEYLIFGMKGNLPFNDRSEMSWFTAKRSKHSQKPGEVIKKIEKVSPPKYLELFGRDTRRGWTVWGNQIRRTLFNEEAFS
jgi:N6-adenosine-specific RNA methylase IME4